eukprot:103600_1
MWHDRHVTKGNDTVTEGKMTEMDELGRVAEQFQLFCNKHLIDADHIVKESDDAAITIEIKRVLNEHLFRVRAVGDKWESALNEKTLENNSMRDTIRELKAKQNDYHQSQVLQQGIDSYIQQRTEEMEQSLAVAMMEKNQIYEELEEERMAHEASRAQIQELKSRNESLSTLMEEMRRKDQYNIDTISAGVAGQFTSGFERNTLQLDAYLNDKLDAVCQAITVHEDVTKTPSIWKKDLEELKQIYRDRFDTKLDDVERENQTLRDKIKANEKQIRLSKQRTIETIQEYQRIEEENNELQTEINDLTESNEVWSEQVESMRIQMKTQRDNDIARRERLSVVEQDNEKLKNELELRNRELENGKRNTEDLKKEMEGLKDEAAGKYGDTIEGYTMKIDQLKTRIGVMEKGKFGGLSRRAQNALAVLCSFIVYFLLKYVMRSRRYQQWWKTMTFMPSMKPSKI